MEYVEKRIKHGIHYLTISLVTAIFVLVLLYPRVNTYLMRSAGSYVIYMLLFAVLVGLIVYVTERILVDVLGSNHLTTYVPV